MDDKVSEVYNGPINQGYKAMTWKCNQHIMKKNLLLLKDSLEP